MSLELKMCRITVLKVTQDHDLIKEYGIKDLGPCPFHKVGDTWETDWNKPANFCEEAWKVISPYVFALAHGVDTFFPHIWLDAKKHKGVSINCCSDALRPVIFKIERIQP